ncbi:hypothetical protein MTE01_03860 [Microbacterium testaceum]|uniref:Helix-turn-helix domain-containing protein n=1 Tax=Microbacterium testaceum TaxID=2033 RepID=A0A4Y3QGU8_MICTE|nr:hypothetical protein MTE01_03860 [Microbacterium testaceum]
MLEITRPDVRALVPGGRLRGVPIGSPPRWRIDHGSVDRYLDEQTELVRRAALRQQSPEATFRRGGGAARSAATPDHPLLPSLTPQANNPRTQRIPRRVCVCPPTVGVIPAPLDERPTD